MVELEKSKEWFKSADRGLFVHWGLYSIPAGEWDGVQIPWFGEWIMHSAKIPKAKYEKLASRFNPTEFNAKKWVRRAEDAGMKYIIFTTKHHDGFAMFDSKADPYNIVRATPFKRDVLAELADACRDSTVKLGAYYSQSMDWHEPGAGNGPDDRGYGNTWDFRHGTPEEFTRYMETKALPQIEEILTHYGPMAMMWFDNPLPSFNLEHALDAKELVRRLQPGCLISNRIGHSLGDIRGWGDNYLPDTKEVGLAEACMTMNDTWGYKKNGGKWKTPEEIKNAIEKAQKNNYSLLLNVGPMANGEFPKEATQTLKNIRDKKSILSYFNPFK